MLRVWTAIAALAAATGAVAQVPTDSRRPQMALVHPHAGTTADQALAFEWTPRPQEKPLSAAEVSQSMMHMMGAPALSEAAAEKLPQPNAQAPPRANVLLAIDGVEHGDASTMPFLHAHPHRANVEPAAPGQPGMAGEVANRLHHGMDALDLQGWTMCLTADETVADSPLCQHAQDTVAWDGDSRFHVRNSERFRRGALRPADDVPLQAEAPLLRAWAQDGGAAQRAGDVWMMTPPAADTAVEFDMTDATDRLLFQELHLISRSPLMLRDGAEEPHLRPDLFVITLNSLPHVLEAYGVDSNKAQVSKLLVDTGIKTTLERLAGEYDSQLAATVLVDEHAAARPLDSQFRRVLTDDTPSPTTYLATTNYTISEIVQYQINMWTGICLILMVLAAVLLMVYMDVQPDSLLYAKFQADTSSKLD